MPHNSNTKRNLQLQLQLQLMGILPVGGVAVLILAVAILGGCAALRPVRNAFASPEPTYKKQYGLTPKAKADRLRGLATEAISMSPVDQESTSQALTETLGTQQDTILRREIVRTLGAFPAQSAAVGLHRATADDDPQVRIAAAQAWGQRQGRESEAALTAMLANDANVDVRMAAIRSLAGFKSVDTVRHLRTALKDGDPAIQLAALRSIKSATGLDLGNNVNKWIAHLDATLPQIEEGSLIDGTPEMVADPAAGGSWMR